MVVGHGWLLLVGGRTKLLVLRCDSAGLLHAYVLSLAQFLGQDCVEGQLGPHRLLGIIVLSCEAAHGFKNVGLEDHLGDGSYLKELGKAFHEGAILVEICQACASATPSVLGTNSL